MGQERWRAIHSMRDVEIIVKLCDQQTSKTEYKLLNHEWQRRRDAHFSLVKQMLDDRRSGKARPCGTTDDKGRWTATPLEECSDCKHHQSTLSDPLRQYRHCCSVEHVARFCSADIPAFKRFLQKQKELTCN